MKKAKLVEFTKENALSVADYYEYSMANANMNEKIFGIDAVFDLVLRNLPKTKVVGEFEYDGVKYDKLEQRQYMVNAGLEQAVAVLTQIRGDKNLQNYFEKNLGIENTAFLNFVENAKFKGDLYAMREGEIFFGQEQQLRVHERFEVAQLYESLLLIAMNGQTNVATTANDISEVVNGAVLLEGGSRRATSFQGATLNSRAARIGGFQGTSNVNFGMEFNEKVGGTHGHSYVMLHQNEIDAFFAQADFFKDDVCFLLDTYNVKNGLEKAIKVVKDSKLERFAFRVDSGNLKEQYFMITERLTCAGFSREQYKMIASDDLNAWKIRELDNSGAKFDKYLVGTYLVCPPKPLGGVYKLAAFQGVRDNEAVLRGKFSEDPLKSTLPGIKQIYRVSGRDGMFRRDIIALNDEKISHMIKGDEYFEPLLSKVIASGNQIVELPGIDEISKYKAERLARLPSEYRFGNKNYPVLFSRGIYAAMGDVRNNAILENLIL